MSVHHPIWVYASHSDGVVQPIAFELLGKARELAAASGAPVEVVVIGHGNDALLEQLSVAGPSRIYSVDDARFGSFSSSLYAHVLADLGLGDDLVGLRGSPTQMLNVFTPPSGRKGEVLQGTPNEVARALIERLTRERVI